MVIRHIVCAVIAFSFSLVATATVNRVDIGEFSKGSLNSWQSKTFVGETDYTFGEDNGRQVLKANSVGSASGIGREIKVDLTKTPYVNWSWKIERRLPQLAENTKAGDDYAARVYIVKSGGALVWNTKALNYVWSGSQTRESSWPNAFRPKNAVMLAARGTGDTTGGWVTEKRNVREDLKKAFGKDFKSIDAIAIMTDTDNSGLSARASYGDIFFTAE